MKLLIRWIDSFNTVAQNVHIACNSIANTIEYELSRPKLNFEGYLTFESTSQGSKPDNFVF